MNAIYFIAGWIFSASALALALIILARVIFRLQKWVTQTHINFLCWLLVISSIFVGYAYVMEFFMAYYSASKYEGDAFLLRAMYGPGAWYYWMMFFCHVSAPQLLWLKWARRNQWVVLAVAMAVNIGMLYERYVIHVLQ